MRSFKDTEEVSRYHGCTGCGACTAYGDSPSYRMDDVEGHGLRPVSGLSEKMPLEYCPGAGLDRNRISTDISTNKSLFPMWGPVIAVYEGYASDDDIRRRGSSGGVLTALSKYCMDSDGYDGVIQQRSGKLDPVRNETVISTSGELIENAGSRYAVSAPFTALKDIDRQSKYVFIGKPCDSAAMRMKMEDKLGSVQPVAMNLSFFCAGTPSTGGNRDYIKHKLSHFNQSEYNIEKLKFRGDGWPGEWNVIATDSSGRSLEATATYEESWGYLQASRQWRCYICPDHSGEYADISAGDAWYKKSESDNPGVSLIVVRTSRGKDLLDRAIADGVIRIVKEDSSLIDRCQPPLVASRGELFGRLLAMRLLGLRTPKYRGYSIFRFWLKLPLRRKVGSIGGTFKRVIKKKLYLPET